MSEWMNNKWSQTHQPGGLWLLSHSAEATAVFVFLPLGPQTIPPTASPHGWGSSCLPSPCQASSWLATFSSTILSLLAGLLPHMGSLVRLMSATDLHQTFMTLLARMELQKPVLAFCLLGKRQDGPTPHMGLAWSLTHFFHIPCPRQLHPL